MLPVGSTTQARFWLAGVEVLASKQTGAIVAIGDSITDGTQSTLNANARWTDSYAGTSASERRRSPAARRTWSPRAGAAVAVFPEGRAIVRGGVGRFAQRTPLNVEAFPTF